MLNAPRPLGLVTGASSGIGAALARELARDGHDLILAARRAEPMQALAEDLRAEGASSTVIAIDLSKAGAAADLVAEIQSRGLVVDVLVNAAGLGAHGRFDAANPLRVSEILQVNVVALTELTRLMLPAMVARGRGNVMLVSSTAAFQPGPQMAVYCATKAYVLSFGEAIGHELKDSGVQVTTLCPGATDTGFAHAADAADTALFKGSTVAVMSASDVARIGYQGLKARRQVVVTGLRNRIMAIASRLSPPSLSLRVSDWILSSTR
jgi:short-subunit dehydrogenase